MKFSAREDSDASVCDVFARLTDYVSHENMAMRRGIQVHRIDGLRSVEPGLTWSISVKFRGKPRQLSVELVELVSEELLVYQLNGSGIRGHFTVELLALSPSRTRMSVALEIRPKNMPGRLLMQSLRILKPTLNRRFRARTADFARLLAQSAQGAV